MLILLMALAQPVHAVGPEVWAALNDGRLVDAADRDSTQAIAIYEAILEHLPTDDPIHGEILYWLGRARYDAGDTEGAREALEEAGNIDPRIQIAASDFLKQIDMALAPIRSLPYHQSYSSEYMGNGFSLAFGEDSAQVSEIHLKLRVLHRSAIQVALLDLDGSRWLARYSGMPEDTWTELTMEMTDFSNAEGKNPSGQDLWQLTISAPDHIGETSTFEIAEIGVF